jgi:hypothetical protein
MHTLPASRLPTMSAAGHVDLGLSGILHAFQWLARISELHRDTCNNHAVLARFVQQSPKIN